MINRDGHPAVDKLYVFPLVATAKDAGGRTAILKLSAEASAAGEVGFLN